MSDFLIRSKDLYLDDPHTFSHFKDVFKIIDEEMHRAKSYYNVDLFDIEEILSLLEMEAYVSTGRRRVFINYLRDVIEALTPEYTPQRLDQYPWGHHIFGPDLRWQSYCFFIATLFNLILRIGKTSTGPLFISFQEQREPSAQYSVISLNYDMVLERCLDLILKQNDTDTRLSFAGDLEEAKESGRVPLAKLHGSVDDPATIVPPTWNKTANPKVQEAWKLAYTVLSEATQIRILGYSLSPTDSHVRYLLESAAMKAPHLKEHRRALPRRL